LNSVELQLRAVEKPSFSYSLEETRAWITGGGISDGGL
jgi:hypothetical protein